MSLFSSQAQVLWLLLVVEAVITGLMAGVFYKSFRLLCAPVSAWRVRTWFVFLFQLFVLYTVNDLVHSYARKSHLLGVNHFAMKFYVNLNSWVVFGFNVLLLVLLVLVLLKLGRAGYIKLGCLVRAVEQKRLNRRLLNDGDKSFVKDYVAGVAPEVLLASPLKFQSINNVDLSRSVVCAKRRLRSPANQVASFFSMKHGAKVLKKQQAARELLDTALNVGGQVPRKINGVNLLQLKQVYARAVHPGTPVAEALVAAVKVRNDFKKLNVPVVTLKGLDEVLPREKSLVKGESNE
ncbi:MAG: hypothetical protein QM571_02925 [Micrococcaceae bacterium]